MRDTIYRDFRGTAGTALRETSRRLRLNLVLVRQPICLAGEIEYLQVDS